MKQKNSAMDKDEEMNTQRGHVLQTNTRQLFGSMVMRFGNELLLLNSNNV